MFLFLHHHSCFIAWTVIDLIYQSRSFVNLHWSVGVVAVVALVEEVAAVAPVETVAVGPVGTVGATMVY